MRVRKARSKHEFLEHVFLMINLSIRSMISLGRYELARGERETCVQWVCINMHVRWPVVGAELLDMSSYSRTYTTLCNDNDKSSGPCITVVTLVVLNV